MVNTLHSAFSEALKAPDVARRLTADGSTLAGGTPAQFGNLIRTEIAKWSRVIKTAGIKME